MEFVSPICLFTCCRLEYIKLGSPSDPTWSDFPQTLTQMQGVRRYVTLFKSPFVDSGLSEMENNALRASSLLAVPPPPPEVQPLEGLQGTNLLEANLTQWASYVQDVASGMQRPPHTATDCPNQDIAGILHRLENLMRVGFCRLCFTLGGHCGCSGAAPQAPPSHMEQALWAPLQPSYASMASSMMTTTGTSMRGVSPAAGPPPGFPAMAVPTPMDVSLSYNPLAHAGVGRGLRPQSAPGSTRPWAPGPVGLHQPRPLALHQSATASGSHEAHPATPYQQAMHPPRQVRFAPPVTKAEATTGQSQSVAERGRPQTREQGGCRSRPLIPEQERTGPPPKDSKSKGVLQARIPWRTSWTLCPQAGRGTLYTWSDAFMLPKLTPSTPANGTVTGTSSFRRWKSVRASG